MSATTTRKPKQNAPSDVEVRRAIVEQTGATVRFLVGCAAAGFVAWCAKEATIALAGLKTEANIAVSFLNKTELAVTLGWMVGLGGVAYGNRERKLRKKTVARLEGRVRNFELGLDPTRSSSGLTAEGDTNPGDH